MSENLDSRSAGIAERTTVPTRAAVAELLAQGLSRTAIARILGVGKGTVSYHVRRLGLTIDERCARRYDWSAVQRYYDEGHTVTECQERFGFSRGTWHEAHRNGRVVGRPQAMPIEELLSRPRCRGHIKQRLIKLGLKVDRCEACGLDEWRGMALSLCLHHVNGIGDDNRLENLMLLCPNCHSQTENFAGRNRRAA